MTDSERLLQEAKCLQSEDGLVPPPSAPTSIKLWVCVAVILVIISLSIEIFWPLPSKNVPFCDKQQAHKLGLFQSCIEKK